MICWARVNHLSYRNMKILLMIWWTPFEIFDFFLIIWFRKNRLISCFYRLYIKLMPLILFNLGWQYWIYLWKWLRNAILMNELFTIIFSNLKNWGKKEQIRSGCLKKLSQHFRDGKTGLEFFLPSKTKVYKDTQLESFFLETGFRRH